MSVFKDKIYDDMDDLSKLCEPTISPLNDFLNKIPDKTVLSGDDMVSIIKKSMWFWASSANNAASYNMDINNLFSSFLSRNKLKEKYHELTYNQRDMIEKCFSLKIKSHDDKQIVLDLEKPDQNFSIEIIKIKKSFDEKETENDLKQAAQSIIYRVSSRSCDLRRLNEMLELLGLDDARKHRSKRYKAEILYDFLLKTIKENTWNIKDAALFIKVYEWILDYVINGRLISLTNFCKFKIMTHDNKPIYSMEEEKE